MEDSVATSEDTDEKPKTVKVQGFKPHTSDDALELYFENPRKGGGEILQFQRHNDVIYITFTDFKVAKTIVEKTHRFGDCDLQVQFSIALPPQTARPSYTDRVLVTGIRECTTTDCLINYLEVRGHCDIRDNNVLYGDNQGMAVVIFDEMPDLEKLQAECAKRPLEGSNLTVSKVLVSKTIIVRGLKSKTTKDTVSNYFEGKRSGNVDGVEVEKVQMISNKGYCLVCFRDHTAIEPIVTMSRCHKLDGATLDVAVYHECLFDEEDDDNDSEPTLCEIPAPVEVKNLDKHKLKFIQESKKSNESLFKDLECRHAKLSWSELDDRSVTLTCTLTKEMPDACSLSSSWASDAENVLLKYLIVLQVEKIHVLQDIWDEVVKEWDVKHTADASVFILRDLSTVVVVGHAAAVTTTVEEVKYLVKKIKETYEKKSIETFETISSIKSVLLHLLLINDFPKKMMKKYLGLTVNIKIQTAEIVFQGDLGDVNKAKLEMYESIPTTKEFKGPSLSEGQLQLINKKSVQDYIFKKLKSKNVLGAWEVSGTGVTVFTFRDTDPMKVAEVISESVVENKQTLDPEAVALLSSEKWKSFTTHLSARFGDRLEFIHETGNSDITIIATDDINFALEVDQFILDNALYTRSVRFPSGILRFLQQYCEREISEIMSEFKMLQASIQYAPNDSEFTINATKSGMDSVTKALKDLAGKIEQTKYVHSRTGMCKLMQSLRGSQFIAGLESRERCIIVTEFVDGQKPMAKSHHTVEQAASAAEIVESNTEHGVKVSAFAEILDNKASFSKGVIKQVSLQQDNLDFGGDVMTVTGKKDKLQVDHYIRWCWKSASQQPLPLLLEVISTSFGCTFHWFRIRKLSISTYSLHQYCFPECSSSFKSFAVDYSSSLQCGQGESGILTSYVARIQILYHYPTGIASCFIPRRDWTIPIYPCSSYTYMCGPYLRGFEEKRFLFQDHGGYTEDTSPVLKVLYPPRTPRFQFSMQFAQETVFGDPLTEKCNTAAQDGKPSGFEHPSEICLCYFSDKLMNINRCIELIERFCEEEAIEKTLQDESLKMLNASQTEKLKCLEIDYQVSVTYQQNLGQLHIQGLQQDVHKASDDVQKILREVDCFKLECQKAEILSNQVQWYFIDVDEKGQETLTKYDNDVNGTIGKAYYDKFPTVTLQAGETKYIIDFNAMEEYPANNRIYSVKVVYNDLIKGAASIACSTTCCAWNVTGLSPKFTRHTPALSPAAWNVYGIIVNVDTHSVLSFTTNAGILRLTLQSKCFAEFGVIDQILDYGKGHKLEGAELNVSIYHECLGVGGKVCDPIWFKMPDSLQVKNLDKHKIKFIRESNSSRECLLKELKHCHSELTWVTGDDSAVELKCSLTTEVLDARRLSRTWKTDAETALKEFLSLLEVKKIKVLNDIWDEVEKGIDAKHTEGASMFLYKDQSSIVVVGYAKFGKKMAEEVNSLVKKVEDDFKRKKQTVSETINKVKLIQLRLLLTSGFPKDMMNKFPGLNVNIKIPKVEISFQGIVGDVKKAQVQMYESLQNTTYSKVQNFSHGQLQLADKKSVRDHIVKKMKSKSLVGVWEITPTEVTILAFSDSDAVGVAQMIKKSVIQNIHPLVPEAIILLSSDGWFKLTTELSKRYGEMIKIIPEPDNSQVVIIATDDIIAAAAEDVINFFSENTIFEQTVKFPAGIQRFLQNHCDNDISKIASYLKSMQVQISYSRMSKEFTIKATKYGVDSSIKALQDLANKVDQKRFVHKRPGIRKLLLSQKGTQFVATLGSSNKCIIEKTFDSSERMTVGSQHVMESTAAAVAGVNVVAKCSMPGQRQLCFVAGDITRMKVDVIVNEANERLNHIGGLARAIVDKGGDSIQRECNNYVSRHGRVPVGAVAISQPGNLPCKLIVHAVGPVWSGGRKGEEDLLSDAIINSLQETDKKNFTSIAIPALSCGIYHYPVPEATNEIVQAIKEYFKDFPASSVRVIYLTDMSINTVNFFIAAGKQVFGNHNMHMEDKSSLTSYGGTFGGSYVKPATAPKR
ncbi:uncharacterized protein LOC121383495 [Gigantopelta aegis]|uniref:uncharacterized protein LOC121383495 n=1 Tax=Gigantopelta aegis TaxID=1735272 RepID=UPI001B88CDDB|nr:uncharacterized protein LOC121383495 [Gigantopelta aegis]